MVNLFKKIFIDTRKKNPVINDYNINSSIYNIISCRRHYNINVCYTNTKINIENKKIIIFFFTTILNIY
jgi:hypothetical protein